MSVEFKDGVLDAPIEQVRLGNAAGEAFDTIAITCDNEGNLVGDLSRIEPHILEQLQTPEARESLRKQYRASRNNGPIEPPRKPKYVNNGGQVRYSHLKPAGMSGKEFRQLRRSEFRRMSKAANRIAGSIR